MKKLDTGQSDILVLSHVPPPPEIEIRLNMNAIGKNHFKRGHQVHFTNLPPTPPPSITII